MATLPSRMAPGPCSSLFLTFVAVVWMGCGGSDGGITVPPTEPPVTPPTLPVSQVTLSSDSLFFGGLGLARSLGAVARAADGTVVSGAAFTWQSSSAAVVSVSSTGGVTAQGVGNATVTASTGGVSATAKVVVLQVAAGLAVSPDRLTLDSLGATATLTAAAIDSGGVAIPGPTEVAWSSEDGGIAVVGDGGVVEARGPGTTSIVVTDPAGLTVSAGVEVGIPSLAGVVDETGGAITLPGTTATLTLPSGAVSNSVALTARSSAADAPDMVTGTAVEIGPVLAFAAPAELVMGFVPSAIPGGADERSLGLYRLSGSTWSEVASLSVDTAANTVRGAVTSTGTFAIRANRLGDPTGLWLVTETTTFDSCYDEVGLVEKVSVYAEKTGDVLTVERDGETVSGTLVGDVFGWDESYVLDGVNVQETYVISIAPTGLTATGSGRFVGSGPVSCQIRTTLQAERVGRERPKATAGVASVILSFVEAPGATSRLWRPDVGDGVQLTATAFDKDGVPVPGAEIVFNFSEKRVLANAPFTGVSGDSVTLHPGWVGATEITAIAVGPDQRTAPSAPLSLTLARDTTTVRLQAPPQGTGRFFDLEPLLVWEDDNGEVDRWEVVAGSQRLRLPLRRTGTGSAVCSAGDRCVSVVSGLWDALGPAGDTPFVRLEGVNALGNVVSRSTFDFTHVVRNRIDLVSSVTTPIWQTQGNGHSPAGASPVNRYPNSQALYCSEAELPGCLHAYVQTQWTPHHEVLVVERRPNRGDWEAARIWLPKKLLDGTVTQSTWSCTRENGALALEDAALVSFRWLENGQIRFASGSNDSRDPNPKTCRGAISVGVEEYSDIRGTWRIFTVSGTGSMITPLGVEDVAFSVQGGVKWADGQVEPPRFWVESR